MRRQRSADSGPTCGTAQRGQKATDSPATARQNWRLRHALGLALVLAAGCEPSVATTSAAHQDPSASLAVSTAEGQGGPLLTVGPGDPKPAARAIQDRVAVSPTLPQKSPSRAKAKPDPRAKPALKERKGAQADHKIGMIGAVERVYVDQLGDAFLARIDTGAATSSVDAQDITAFERDGEEWVRFTTSPRPNRPFEPAEDKWPDGEEPEAIVTELPIVDRVTIESGVQDQKRYVVKLGIVLGKHQISGRFTLNDRSQLNYGVLLGRNLLAGNAVVDVSQNKLQGRPKVERPENEPSVPEAKLRSNKVKAGAPKKPPKR